MRILILAICFMVTGCATKYIAPTNSNLAQLRINAPQFGGWSGMRAVLYQDGSCDKPTIFGVISGVYTSDSDLNTTIPTIENHEKGKYFDKFIEADKTIKMTVSGSFAATNCKVPVEFVLQKGGIYEMFYYWEGRSCKVEIVNINKLNESSNGRVKLTDPIKPCYSGFSGPAF